jgi:CheY-like chemotaxis protein
VLGYVLVVDDDPAMLGAMATILAIAKQCCRIAPNGEEAYDAALVEHPTLIVVDFNMPGMNGIELLEKLRAAGIQSPAVLMSAEVKDLRQRAESAGFNAYLPKPFALAEMMTLLERFIVPNAA